MIVKQWQSLRKILCYTSLLAMAGLVFTACAPAAVNTGNCSLHSQWTIDFRRTGGFAGQTLALQLSRSGKLIIKDGDRNITYAANITMEEITQIEGQLIQACPFQSEMRLNRKGQPDVCPDCFLYTLDIKMDGQKFSAQATDTSMSASLRPLIDSINVILNKTVYG